MKTKLMSIVNAVIDIPMSIINTIKAQLTTGKGILMCIFVGLLVLDLISKGSFGFVNYGLDFAKDIVKLVKSGGWGFIAVLFIIFWRK